MHSVAQWKVLLLPCWGCSVRLLAIMTFYYSLHSVRLQPLADCKWRIVSIIKFCYWSRACIRSRCLTSLHLFAWTVICMRTISRFTLLSLRIHTLHGSGLVISAAVEYIAAHLDRWMPANMRLNDNRWTDIFIEFLSETNQWSVYKIHYYRWEYVNCPIQALTHCSTVKPISHC